MDGLLGNLVKIILSYFISARTPRGGFGHVYAGVREKDHKLVAIKARLQIFSTGRMTKIKLQIVQIDAQILGFTFSTYLETK